MKNKIMNILAVPLAYIAFSGAAQAAESSLIAESILAEDFSETTIRLDTENGSMRVMQTETDTGSETLAGARVPLKSPYFTGNAVLFAQSTGTNDALGFNLTGRVPGLDGLLLGLCLESDPAVGDLTAGFVGKEFGDWIVAAGAAGVEGNETYLFHANIESGRNVFGISAQSDFYSEGSAGIAVGRTSEGDRGNGFGYRAWARTDFDQAHLADLILTTNTGFSRGRILAPIAIENGGFDQSIIPNVMDVVPGNPTYLDEWSFPGGTAVELKYIHTPAGESGLAAVAFNMPETESGAFAMFGLDYAVSKQASEDAVQSITPKVGVRYGHFKLDYGCTMQEGEKPVHEAIASMAIDF
jgi:hypothetical protein